MLDIHAGYVAAGSTALTAATATAFTNDTGTFGTQGLVPVQPNATLVAFGGGAVAVADAIKEVQLKSQDLNDAVNYSDYKMAGTSTQIMSPFFRTKLPFKSGGRVVSLAQAAAAAEAAYLIDHYPAPVEPCVKGTYYPENSNFYTQVAGQANVAGAWTSTLFAPAGGPPPAGKYAILGAWGENMTATTGWNLVAFSHALFGAFRPGFPLTNVADGTLTVANYGGADDVLVGTAGYQFVRLGDITGTPQCPVFNVTSTSTSLLIWTGSVNTDTPNIILNLMKVG